MYAVSPAVEAAWEHLFAWVSARADVPLLAVRHPAPAPLEALWARTDLGIVFMCGLPFARSHTPPTLLVAPVPRAARWTGLPIYATDLIVRRDSCFQTLEETFGARIGWTVEHSQSGYNATRHHLADLAAGRQSLYRSSLGPLLTPLGAIAAVLDGRVDVAPLDGYFYELAQENEPALVADLRVVATTDPTPIPPLVGSPAMPEKIAERLRTAFLQAAEEPEAAHLLAKLALKSFARIEPARYSILAERDRAASRRGYPAIR